MGFTEAIIVRSNQNKRFGPQAKVAVTQRYGFRVWVRARLAEEMGWTKEDHVALFIGEGDDAKKVRLVRKPDGIARLLMLRGGAWCVSFNRALGTEIHPSELAQAKKIDADTIEIVLPDWTAKVTTRLKFSDEQPAEKLPPAPNLPPVLKPVPPKIRQPARVNGVVSEPAVNAKPRGFHVERMGIDVTLLGDKGKIVFNQRSLTLLESQAYFLRTLVEGFGGVMVTADIIQKTGSTAEEIRGDFMDLQRPLQEIDLKLTYVRNFGYCLSKA